MLWEVEILPSATTRDHEGQRIVASARSQGIQGLHTARSARSFLIQGELDRAAAERAARQILCDTVVEEFRVHSLPASAAELKNVIA